jgi:hypothetical protein
MSFRLTIDGPAWDRTLHAVAARNPGLVPVIKGNGYGFGSALLADRARELGVPVVAVGVASEIDAIRAYYAGDVLVMGPLQRSEVAAMAAGPVDPTVLRTVAHPEVLRAVAELAEPPRVVIELDSPMHRHGISQRDLLDLVSVLRRVPLAGIALHLPGEQPAPDRFRVAESALRSVATLRSAGVEAGALWVSHLSEPDLARLDRADPLTLIRSRVGTGLWLADRSTFTASGTVLDSHQVLRHQPIGYRQRRSPAGTVIVVSGGTAHGVGLQTSVARGGWRDLARGAVLGAAHGAGLTPSPFRWAGRRLRYADVPHMQVSMLLVPTGMAAPAVGERLECTVRMTVTTFDEIEVGELHNLSGGSRVESR